MTATMHRRLTIAALILTQVASVTTAVIALLAGAGLVSTLAASLVPQIVGDVVTGLVTVIRMIDDPQIVAAAIVTPITPPAPKP